MKVEINRTKIKGGCQSGIKVVTHNSKNDLLLVGASRSNCRGYHCCFLAPASEATLLGVLTTIVGNVPKSSDWLFLLFPPSSLQSMESIGIYLRSSSNLSYTGFFSLFVGTHSQSSWPLDNRRTPFVGPQRPLGTTIYNLTTNRHTHTPTSFHSKRDSFFTFPTEHRIIH